MIGWNPARTRKQSNENEQTGFQPKGGPVFLEENVMPVLVKTSDYRPVTTTKSAFGYFYGKLFANEASVEVQI